MLNANQNPMKVVILAGGLGTRLAEETTVRPKPMVEIGGRPILDHIMQWYAHFGYTEFVIALGYKGDQIKQYFLNYYALNSDISVSLKDGNVTVHDRDREDWIVHLVDTGHGTYTGGRISRVRRFLTDDHFMLTYGDGLSDVDLRALVTFHQSHGKKATLTAVKPPSRFGGLALAEDRVRQFVEKPPMGEGYIIGGFFVLSRSVLEMLHDNSPMWEANPLENLAANEELMAYKHDGFWQAMDNVREKQLLEEMWNSGQAPWRIQR